MTTASAARSGSLRRRLIREAGVILAAAVFLAVSGAFIGGEPPLWRRFVYWLGMIAAGAAWGWVCSRLVRRVVDFDERPWLASALLIPLCALPFSVFVWAVTGPAFGQPIYEPKFLPNFVVPVVLLTAVMTALGVLLERTSRQTHAAPPGAAPARFLDRLPPKLRGARLIAVQAEDHYLRLHTDRGSDLILMRLSDALGELEGLEGAQTHRSWWVAKDAVREVSRGDGRAALTLDGGLTAPVSRRHAPGLRKAGWY